MPRPPMLTLPTFLLTHSFHHYVAVPVAVSVTVKTVSAPPVRMPLLLGRVRGNNAAGPRGRPPSFPRKSGQSSMRV